MSRVALFPAIALGAFVLAGMALVMPIPLPKPPAMDPVAPAPGPSEPKPSAAPDQPPVETWTELVGPLSVLIDAPSETPAATTAEVTPEDPVGQAAQPEVKPSVMLPPLAWRFSGTISGPGSIAAVLVMGNGSSRIAFQGMRLADEYDPSGPGVLIANIADERVTLDRRGESVTLHREHPEPTHELSRRAASQRLQK